MSDFEYFKPYEGDKPYIFISYAHADDDAVLPIVSDMHRRGYNIWYDEGIEVGSEWQECIASHLADAHLVVAFISNAYMRSDNCRREMHYAQSKKIKTINIFIEETALTPGMELQIGNIFALMKYTYPSDEYFYDKLYSAPLLNSENFADASPRPTTETAIRRYLHDTPVHYLVKYRLQEAAKLLATTEKKITVISGETGFENMDYFCKTFKKYYGRTPTEYRRKKQMDTDDREWIVQDVV